MLTAVFVLIQSVAQVVAVTVLRRRQPNLPRPYRMWLYPLPSVIALVGWLYIYKSAGTKPILLSLAWLAAGGVAFLIWARAERTWPFGPKEIRESFIGDAEQTEGAKGRPMTQTDAAGFVLGIDFGGTKIALATATTAGTRLRSHPHRDPRRGRRGGGHAADAGGRAPARRGRRRAASPGRGHLDVRRRTGRARAARAQRPRLGGPAPSCRSFRTAWACPR